MAIDYEVLKQTLVKRGEKDLSALCDAFELCRTSNDHQTTKIIRRNAAGLVRSGGGSAALELYNRSLTFDGVVDFDCFMRATEKNRDPKDQYWLPRRRKLMHICRALQDMEEDKLDELFLSMPPRTGKSTLIMFFVLWIILRDSERSNLYVSYTDSVVKPFYKGLLEVLTDTVTYAWNDVFPAAKIVSTDAADLLINIDRKKRYASFTGRSLYGTLNGACDCSGYEIADDIHSGVEEAMSEQRLLGAWMRVENNYLPRVNKSVGKRLWIGTRWSLRDCQARRMDVLENDAEHKDVRWKLINTPALDENDESNFEYDYGIGFSTQAFRRIRASFERNNDIASFNAQYQGMPIERAGALFEPDDMRMFNGVLPDEIDRTFMCIDPAWGGGDFTAAAVCCQCGDDVFVPAVVFDDGDKRVTQPLIVNAIKKWNVRIVKVEGTKMTASYGEEIDKKLKGADYKVNMQINTSHFTGTGKESRIFNMAPDIREHFVFLAEGNRPKEYSKFMQNLYSFTIGGKKSSKIHDDAPDVLAMCSDFCFFGRNLRAEVIARPF